MFSEFKIGLVDDPAAEGEAHYVIAVSATIDPAAQILELILDDNRIELREDGHTLVRQTGVRTDIIDLIARSYDNREIYLVDGEPDLAAAQAPELADLDRVARKVYCHDHRKHWTPEELAAFEKSTAEKPPEFHEGVQRALAADRAREAAWRETRLSKGLATPG